MKLSQTLSGIHTILFCTMTLPPASRTVTVTGAGFAKLLTALIDAVAILSAAAKVNDEVERNIETLFYAITNCAGYIQFFRKTGHLPKATDVTLETFRHSY